MKCIPLTVVLLGTFFSATCLAQDHMALYNKGVDLKKQQKIPEAVSAFKESLGLKPDYTPARYELGWCYNDLGVYDQAITQLRQVREVWPTVPKVFFELGYAFQKMQETDSAVKAYRTCLSYKPDYSNALKQLGFLEYDAERYTSALSYFAQYEAAAKTEITDYLYFYRKGFMYNALKKYDSALTALQRSEQLKPSYLNTWLEKGFAYTRLKQSEEAIRNFKKAQEIDPKSHIPYNGIGEVYRDLIKDREQAMNWYKKALEVKPNERKACYGIGYCLNALSRSEEAIPWLKKSIEQEADYTAAYVELGYAYYRTGNNPAAITNLQQAIRLNPANENSRYYLILVYVAQRDKAKAQQVLQELRNLGSKYVKDLEPRVNAL